MSKVERRIISKDSMTSTIQRVGTVEIPVLYGLVEREVILRESHHVNPSPRTLTKAERTDLRERNRLAGRPKRQ